MKKFTIFILSFFVFVSCLFAESEMFVVQEKDEWGDPTGDSVIYINSESAIYRDTSGEEKKLTVQMKVYPATHTIELGIYDLNGKAFSTRFDLDAVRYRFGSNTVYKAYLRTTKYSNVYFGNYEYLIAILQSGSLRILINDPTRLDVTFACDRDNVRVGLK